MNYSQVKIGLGKDLSDGDLVAINYHRRAEFHSDSDILPLPDNDEWEKPYFLVKDDQGTLLGFGILHFLKVKFRGTTYPVLGIASILSIEIRKGYGRLILEKKKEYVQGKQITAIGFCDPEDTGFYEKCGLGVIKGMERFEFPGGPKNSDPGDVIYIDGGDGLVDELKKYSKDKIEALSPEW
jgi:hypothetical protein